MDNTEVINVLSLCSGYAGMELGLSRVFETAMRCVAVEIEAFALANLVSKAEEGKLGIEAVYSDIRTFPSGKFRGCFDIITAGYPCQPFSHAGKRKGESDERHLWPAVCDSIEKIEPALVICENVAGHLSLGFDRVVCDLEDLGYTVEGGIYAAAETGAPHRRERLIFVAYRQCDGLSWLLRQAGQGTDRAQLREDPDGQGAGGGGEGPACQLADAEGGRCGQEGQCGSDETDGTAGPGDAVSDAEHIGGDTGSKRGGRQKGADLDRSGEGSGLADSDESGTASSRQDRGMGWKPQSYARWPARPGQEQYEWECPRTLPVRKGPKPTGWDEYLARIAAAAQSELGGTTDGITDTLDAIANRVDRLRLCGNGVVPLQLAMAIEDILEKIRIEEKKIKN